MCVYVCCRDMLLQILSGSQLVVCYKAKDLLRTALQFYKRGLDWKQGAGQIQTPHVATSTYTYSCRSNSLACGCSKFEVSSQFFLIALSEIILEAQSWCEKQVRIYLFF